MARRTKSGRRQRRGGAIRRRRKESNIANKNKYIIAYTLLFVGAVCIIVAFINSTITIKNLTVPTFSEDIVAKNNDLTEKLSTENEENVEKGSSKKEDTTITLSAIGDIICHNTQYNDAYDANTKTYDFSYVFENIKYYTQTSDLAIGNLETTFGGAEKGYKSYPTFNTPDELARNLKSIGIDVVSTANNHCLDTGYEGLERTIDVLDQADISHLGTYKSQEERDTILIKYAKGVKIAFINYTYGTNGIAIPSGKEYCVNTINKELIAKDIEAAKAQTPDIIVACMHWGVEYQTAPNAEQKELADFLFQNGVNVIIGNHPHVLQPMEKRTVTLPDGTQRDGFIIYSLGNFTADQKQDDTKNSIILDIKLTKHADGSDVTVDSATYTPINMFKYNTSSHKFKLLDIKRSLEAYEAGDLSLGSNNYIYLQQQLSRIRSIVGAEF